MLAKRDTGYDLGNICKKQPSLEVRMINLVSSAQRTEMNQFTCVCGGKTVTAGSLKNMCVLKAIGQKILARKYDFPIAAISSASVKGPSLPNI